MITVGVSIMTQLKSFKVAETAVVILIVYVIFGKHAYNFVLKVTTPIPATSRCGSNDRINDEDLGLTFVPNPMSFRNECRDVMKMLYSESTPGSYEVTAEFQRRTSTCAMKCSELFRTPETRNFDMSSVYRRQKSTFFTFVNETLSKHPQSGGDSYYFPEQYRALHFLAGMSEVRTVCETGFAAGRSSFAFLTANPDVVVHSFDLGEFKYTQLIAEYLHTLFPRRFFVHFGDSKKTLPTFIAENPNVRCDVMFVDGDHAFDACRSDLRHFSTLAQPKGRNFVVFDDYPRLGGVGDGYGRAWELAVQAGVIRERMRCTRQEMDGYQRGFTIGSFVKCDVGA